MLDEILYGKDPDPYIVAVEPVWTQDFPAVKLYYRINDRVQEDIVNLYPFFYLHNIKDLDGYSREAFKWMELSGDNHFHYLCVFDSFDGIKNAVKFLRDKGKDGPHHLYRISNYAEQYLVQSGKTLFKDMMYNDLHRLQFDIEVLSSGRKFPDAKRKGDEIFMVSFSDNRGWSHVLDTRTMTEKDLLKQTIRIIKERDPDVIENHNIFKFDLPYIEERCKLHGITFAVGRDGSKMRSYPHTYKAAERFSDYTHYLIHGRHIVDTYFLAMQYDVYARALPSLTLKECAKFFGFAKDDREYVQGDQIANVWREDPERIVRYALDDVQEARDLAEKLAGNNFYLTKMVPMSYQKISVTGPTAKLERLFVREYLKQRHSIPCITGGEMTTGGLSQAVRQGIYGPVIYADVNSLYPAIMIEYKVEPRDDDLGVFQHSLKFLRNHRFEVQDERVKYDEGHSLWSALDAEQNAVKIFINSFFGGMGSPYFIFNDIEEADRVTKTGQKLLMQMVNTIESKGGTIINLDTDGVVFVPPSDVYVGTECGSAMLYGDKFRTCDTEFVTEVSDVMPKGINIGFDGRFKKILCYKAKNYALLDFKNKIKYKGSSFKNRSNESFGLLFMKDIITILLSDDMQKAHDYYNKLRDQIINKELPITSYTKTNTLTDSLKVYQHKIKTKARHRAAHYELALQLSKDGRKIDKGDRISYYVTGVNPNVKSFESCKLLEDYDESNPDENVHYYLNKLDNFAERFQPLLAPQDYRLIFSTPNLFTELTDYEDMTTVTHKN